MDIIKLFEESLKKHKFVLFLTYGEYRIIHDIPFVTFVPNTKFEKFLWRIYPDYFYKYINFCDWFYFFLEVCIYRAGKSNFFKNNREKEW